MNSKEVKISKANSGPKNGMWKGGKPRCDICNKELWWGSKLCKSHSKTGINNPNWKGDQVGYMALHDWVRKYKVKSSTCDNCGSNQYLEWANVSRTYQRNINDWKTLCAKCHRLADRRGLPI